MARNKPELPPLFAQGFHQLNVGDLEPLVVDAFPHSSTRGALWQSFRWLVAELERLKLRCTIWVDGSFTTEKIDPDDVDMVLEFDFDFLNNLDSPQRAFVEALGRQDFHDKPKKLHTFIIYSAPIVHQAGPQAAALRRQWERDFGFSLKKRTPKGIVQIEVLP